MLSKKNVVFGLLLFFICPNYAYSITDKAPEQIFCHYDIGDWYGSSKYDEQSDKIIIKNCAWGIGYDCNTYEIPKLVELDNIKVYYNKKHPENIFINTDGHWKWNNAGCDFNNIDTEIN